MFGKRILLLVPHPDDEVVACAAAIGRAQQQGAEIFACYLTHGCIARETLWPWQRKHHDQYVATRCTEAEHVAALLNITPVGWSSRPARHLWQNLPVIHEEVKQTIVTHNIDQFWVPAYEGGNADHDGLNALAQKFTKSVSILEFAEYNFYQGRTHSQAFPYPNGTEHILTLTPEECAKKRTALKLYASERSNLNYVDVTREAFRPLAQYNYSQPPHPGTLWYARFQWVPFRHPRVDFTNPADVSHVITRFLNLPSL